MVRQEETDCKVAVMAAQDFASAARLEHEAMSLGVRLKLKDGSLPPEEAYWWARILAEDAGSVPAGCPR